MHFLVLVSAYLPCILLSGSSKNIFSPSLRSLTTLAPVPDRYCSCTVVPFRYLALEVCVFEGVVFCLDGEPPDARFGWRCFWERKTFEDAVYFQSEVVVMVWAFGAGGVGLGGSLYILFYG